MQTFTSSATSINSTKLPAVYRKATLSAPLLLDYGCGKHITHIFLHVMDKHIMYLPYDPYNQPDSVNGTSLGMVATAIRTRTPVDVVCSNVLNVIDDDQTVADIADTIETVAERTGGTAYVTVYEGDRSGVGRQTGRDQYQRNEPLRNYLKYFRSATIRNGMIVVGH